MPIDSRKFWALACALLMSAAQPAVANEAFTASKRRGFDANAAMVGAAGGVVNTFNGNLALSVPLGQAYTFPSGMSYSFAITYNSRNWDAYVRRGVTYEGEAQSTYVGMSFPTYSNVALGWHLSLGELLTPGAANGAPQTVPGYQMDMYAARNQGQHWAYMAPDGSRHEFYENKRANSPYGIEPGVLYTNDGSHLRLRQLGELKRAVEFPDGSRHIFECHDSPEPRSNLEADRCWKLRRMEDRYFVEGDNASGAFVDITYSDDGLTNTISDSLGRVHHIQFEALAITPTNANFPRRVTAVQLAAPHGATAEFRFDAEMTSLMTECALPYQRAHRFVLPNGGLGDVVPQTVDVPILNTVVLPDTSQYSFNYKTENFYSCETDTGRLEAMTSPTGKYVEWEYDDIGYGSVDCAVGDDSGDNQVGVDGIYPVRPIRTWQGVVETREYESEGAAVAATWKYIYELPKEPAPSPAPPHLCHQMPRQMTTVVVDPRGNATAYYYNIYQEDEIWDHWCSTDIPADSEECHNRKGSTTSGASGWDDTQFSWPATRYFKRPGLAGVGEEQHELFLQSEFYGCPEGHVPGPRPQAGTPDFFKAAYTAGCTLERQTYVALESDASNPPSDYRPHFLTYETCLPSEGGKNCAGTDLRTLERMTVYTTDGGRVKSQRFDDYDGFGNFGKSVIGGDFTAGEAGQTSLALETKTNFLLGADQVPAASEPWLLGLSDSVERKRGGQVARTEQCVDKETGFVTRTRTLAEFGTTRSRHDLVTVLTPRLTDGGHQKGGEVALVKFFGGDEGSGQSIPIGGCPMGPDYVDVFADETPTYAQSVQYQHGQVNRVAFLDCPSPSCSQEVLVAGLATIDQNSGAATSEFDAAGVESTARYDVMGRVVTTAGTGMPTQRYAYCLATQSDRDDLCAAAYPNMTFADSSADGRLLSQTTTVFDSSARVTLEIEPTPLTADCRTDRKRVTTYYDWGPMRTQTPWLDQSYFQEAPVPGCAPDSTETPKKTEYFYNVHGQLSRVKGPDTRQKQIGYAGDRKVFTTIERELPDPDSETGYSDQEVAVNYFMDELGQLVKVEDYGHGSGDPNKQNQRTETTYTYDVNGKLTKADQLGSEFDGHNVRQWRTYEYDAAGRLTSTTIPEYDNTVLTRENHSMVLRYDALGNVLSSGFSGETATLAHEYDKVGRLVRTSELRPGFTPLSRPLVENTYGIANDAADKSLGKLVSSKRYNYLPVDPTVESSASEAWVVRERYRYENPSGMMTSVQTTAARLRGSLHAQNSAVFLGEVEYDNQSGELSELQYPACLYLGCAGFDNPRRSVGFHYDLGKVYRIDWKDGDSDRPLADYAYHPNGMLDRIDYFDTTSSITTRQRFLMGTSQMPRIAGITLQKIAGATTTSLWSSGAYLYDGAGDIRRIGTDAFHYDRAGRLVDGSVGGRVQSMAYDGFGNIISMNSPAGNRTQSVNSRTNRLTGAGYEYDQRGNQISNPTGQMHFDALEMPSVGIWGSGADQRRLGYVYGPGNRRIATTDYVDGKQLWTLRGASGKVLTEALAEPDSGFSWARDYVYSGSTLMTSFEADGASVRERRYHSDHLGSTRVVTDAAGNAVATYAYYPFGEIAQSTGSEATTKRLLFTGHERDGNGTGSADDLDYMMARFMSPADGRFLSLDPIAGSKDDPQSLNRYSYVSNDPINSVDPTGMQSTPAARSTPSDGGCSSNDHCLQQASTNYFHVAEDWLNKNLGMRRFSDPVGDASGPPSNAQKILFGGHPTNGDFLTLAYQAAKQVVSGGGGALATLGSKVLRAAVTNEKIPSKRGIVIPNRDLSAPPPARGRPPLGSDGHPVELHHRGQLPDSPLDEMTRTAHRGKGNFKQNHTNTGQHPSEINRAEWSKQRNEYWAREWDSGRFDNFP